MARRITEAQVAYAKKLAESGCYSSVREVADKAGMSERSARNYGVAIPPPVPNMTHDPFAMPLGAGSSTDWRSGVEARLGEDLRGVDFWSMELGGSDHRRAVTGVNRSPSLIADEAMKSMEAALDHDANLVAQRRQAGLPVAADQAGYSDLDDHDCRWASLWLDATALPYTPTDISRLARERRQKVYGDKNAPYPAQAAVQRVVVHRVMEEEAVKEWCDRYSREVVPVPVEVLNSAYAAAADAIAEVRLWE